MEVYSDTEITSQNLKGICKSKVGRMQRRWIERPSEQMWSICVVLHKVEKYFGQSIVAYGIFLLPFA